MRPATQPILAALIGVIGWLLATGCSATSRMGSVVVTQVGDVPCFALEDTRATRTGDPRLFAIDVYTFEARAGEPIWSFTVPFAGPGVPAPPTSCVTYGQVLPTAAQIRPPQALHTGVVYVIWIGARVKELSTSTQGYLAEFCLLRQPDQTLRIHQVRWDSSAGEWQREICLGK